ncbi:hypothetical protein OG478_12630 [Streptomyces phaeochromogenes]|nr:hypothetical protein OG478_12630 [Streptomyces phaeochromogenes]
MVGHRAQERAAIARLTKNVDDLRNEQRRRQQLDQVTEQASPTTAPSA